MFHPIVLSLCWCVYIDHTYIACLVSLQHYITDPENTDHRDLFDLIWCMLKYCPKERVTLREAFRHPFFAKYSADDSSGSRADNGDRERSHSISR